MKKLATGIAAAAIAVSGLLAFASPAIAQSSDDYYTNSTYDDYTTNTLSDEAAAGIFASFGIIWLVVCCVIVLVEGVLAYIVYNDAKKNNIPNGTLWAVLTFLFGLLPLLIYFLAIKKNGTPAAA